MKYSVHCPEALLTRIKRFHYNPFIINPYSGFQLVDNSVSFRVLVIKLFNIVTGLDYRVKNHLIEKVLPGFLSQYSYPNICAYTGGMHACACICNEHVCALRGLCSVMYM